MATTTLGAKSKAWLVNESDKVEKKKPKRIVKHKKKAWRVTSIEDVERYLESKRLDERLGAPFEERPSESLFILDTQAVSEKPAKVEPTKKKKLKEIGPLRCYSILTPSSAVQDPLKRRNRVRLPEERGDPLLRKIMEKRRANGKIATHFVQSMKHHQENVEALANKKKPERLRTNFDFDLWGEAGDSLLIGDKRVSALELSDQLKTYTMEKTGKRIYSRPQTMFSKTTGLKQVEIPHPGTSYNPTFQDHQALLREAYDFEAKEIREEVKTRRRLGPMLKKIPIQRKEQQWWTEMTQGLAEEEEPTNGPEEEVPAVRPTKPKTRKQKIRAKALKWQDMRRKKLKEAKKRLLEFERLRSIRREIRKSEELTVKRIEIRKKEKEAKMFKPAMLGKHKYEPPLIEVNLSEDIAGTLRGLKTEGNFLVDRYKSLQRRNIIEPRIRQRVVYKYKHKVFTKRSHSEPKGLKVGKRNNMEK